MCILASQSCLLRQQRWKFHKILVSYTSNWRHRQFSISSRNYNGDCLLQKTRNIGIIAHIDAGKTTTTERMLYYGGLTRRIGDVDEGSTVTDFLPAERERGITIQSAAVTFHWPPTQEGSTAASVKHRAHHTHKINLIDTPGHADFTFEVLRSLRVLDGAVCVLDGVAGVEAQTEKVWAQAQKFNIPRIVFVNKLDRIGAAFERTVKEVATRLRGFPALCQIPWWEGGKGRFCGIGDVINLCALKWKEKSDGKSIQSFSLEELAQEDSGMRSELIRARGALVELLCEFDEQLLEAWLLTNDNSLLVTAQDIRDSLRRCLVDGSGRLIPIFAGASFRNIGIQPLLDAINDLLPDPTERPDPEITVGSQKGGLSDLIQGKLTLDSASNKKVAKKSSSQKSLISNLEACALAFKVVNDVRRGVLVYIRVYSGSIKKNAILWNTNLQVAEKPSRIFQMQASDAVEISQVDAGQIGVIAGLKDARTGDTLISYPNLNPKLGPPNSLSTLQLCPIDVPPPVFFAAIEPHSLSEEKIVGNLLSLMLREDPSLHVDIDEDSGQMLLSGMGELHLEIARDRLVNDFKAKATMGNIEISYRECILSPTSEQRVDFDREIAGRKGIAACEASIQPINQGSGLTKDLPENTVSRDNNLITIQISGSKENLEAQIQSPELSIDVIISSLINGVVAALARGPLRSFPICNSHVTIKFNAATDFFGKETSPAALSSAARLAVRAVLKDSLSKGQVAIMEPIMNVVISCDEASLGYIVHDISSARGGQITSLENDDPEGEVLELPAIDPGRFYVPSDPFSDSSNAQANDHGQRRHIAAKVPLKEMVGYLKQLRSLTAGRGTFIMSFDKFEKLTGPREKAILT
ncbi:Ribosome-releasing factor 2 [Podosphaera aphanis]|nr:Ribosome-releasing factor 2 [Podosphaera aphanis]